MQRQKLLHNSTSVATNSKRLLVGKINGLFGVRGWVKIFSHTHPRKNILSYQPWSIQVGGQWHTLAISNAQEQSKTIVAKIKGFDNRQQARMMLGTNIYVDRSQLPKLNKGEYYWQDLINLKVVNQLGIVLGTVKNLVYTGANHVLVVQGEKEHWVPYIAPFLCEVDIEKQQILVDWDKDF